MQDGLPVPDPVCGRCKKKIDRAGRTEAVYQDGIWFHTACHRAGADQLVRAMRLSEALKDVKQGVDVIQSTLVQRDDPLRVHADIGEARSSPPGQRWRPRDGEHYFLIQGHGRIAIVPWNDTAFDHETWHFGNCFQTYAHAKQARQQLKALLHTFHHEHP